MVATKPTKTPSPHTPEASDPTRPTFTGTSVPTVRTGEVIIKLEVLLPNGYRITRSVTAQAEWRQGHDMNPTEYAHALLQRTTATVHRAITEHMPPTTEANE